MASLADVGPVLKAIDSFETGIAKFNRLQTMLLPARLNRQYQPGR